jgi:hypothetical protein
MRATVADREAPFNIESDGERVIWFGDGAKDAITTPKFELDAVTIREVLPAGVFGPFESKSPGPAVLSLWVVPAPAATWKALLTVAKIVQEFSITVVTDVVRLVMLEPVFVVLASGTPLCFAPLYEEQWLAIKVEADCKMTTLFAPEAGLTRYQRPHQRSLGHWTAPILVIAAPAYVTPVTTSLPPFEPSVIAKRMRLEPVPTVCE